MAGNMESAGLVWKPTTYRALYMEYVGYAACSTVNIDMDGVFWFSVRGMASTQKLSQMS